MVKILIVEDEELMAEALRDKLRNIGFDVEYVMDGKSALRKIEEKNYDLIVLDLILPIMDGFQFLEELAKKNVKIPVIVSSNLSSEEDIDRVKKLGVKDYFVKVDTPIEEIAERIKRVLD